MEAAHWCLGSAFVLLGLGSWITINGIYQELVPIAQTAPEGYDIFSYAAVATALGNIFPLVYLAMQALIGQSHHQLLERSAVLVFVGAVGVSGCFFLGARWDSTGPLFGHPNHSTALIASIFVLGGIDCLTSVLFYPIAARFPRFCVQALLAGETATGLLASVLAAIQDHQGSDDFSVDVFFHILAAPMALAVAGYIYIEFSPGARALEERPVRSARRDKEDGSSDHDDDHQATLHLVHLRLPRSSQWLSNSHRGCAGVPSSVWVLFGGQACLAFLENGLFTTVLPHSLLPYAHSDDLVSIAVKVGFGGATVVALLAHLVPIKTRGQWLGWSFVCIATSIWLLITGANRVSPESQFCAIVTLLAGVLGKWTLTYLKATLFLALHPSEGQASHAHGDDLASPLVNSSSFPSAPDRSRLGLLLGNTFLVAGAGIQLGSLVGSVLFFLLSVTFNQFN